MAQIDWEDFMQLNPQARARASVQLKLIPVGKLANPPKAIGKENPNDRFAAQCAMRKLPLFIREHQFAKSIGRRWSFDFAFYKPRLPSEVGLLEPSWQIAVELEGFTMRRINGAWQMGGRHASVVGFKEDCVKYNTAALMGWTVYRFCHTHVAKGYALDTVIRALTRCGWVPPA